MLPSIHHQLLFCLRISWSCYPLLLLSALVASFIFRFFCFHSMPSFCTHSTPHSCTFIIFKTLNIESKFEIIDLSIKRFFHSIFTVSNRFLVSTIIITSTKCLVFSVSKSERIEPQSISISLRSIWWKWNEMKWKKKNAHNRINWS